MLTKKQHELLLMINQQLTEKGVSPSYDEMKDALELRSKSGIHRLIKALEERGFIRRLPFRARALEVLRMPPGTPHIPMAEMVETDPKTERKNVIPGNFPRSGQGSTGGDNHLVALPLYGRIAAGTPIEALRDYTNSVDVPAALLTAGDHYALEIAGDSMVDDGIFDGDTVIIKRCDSAENGTIVVALIEDAEVTLKRLRKRGHAVALEPANRNYETRIFGPDQVQVQGRLVGLIRTY